MGGFDQFASTPERQPIHRGDDWFAKRLDTPGHAMPWPHEMYNRLCRACLHVALEGSNVRASTEGASCSGVNDRA